MIRDYRNHKRFIVCLFVFYGLFFNILTARLANEDEVAVKTDYFKEDILVNPDGTYESIIDYQVTLIKEQGRGTFSQLILSYHQDVYKLDILEAATVNNGQIYNVDKAMIEDKPLASSPGGFDQKRQIMIPYPNLEINSRVRLKYKITNIQPILEKTFSHRILEDLIYCYVTLLQVKLKSAIPLNIKVNDPNKVLNIYKDKEEGLNNLEITNIKPINQSYIEEPSNGLLNDAKKIWVSVSSVKNWQEVGGKLAVGYEKVINQPLPDLFKNIEQAVNSTSDDISKINTVTSLLNEKIQYMGDWRTIKGKIFPRPLDLIATSQVGDCKDFSASTAAILKQLGYKVQAALVMRGETNLPLLNLPGANNFNHAILKVTNKKGDVYWVDPTNFVSMSQGIFPDINGKKALALDLNNSTYEQIPYISINHAQIVNYKELQTGFKNNAVLEKGKVFFKGEEAFPITGMELYMSKNTIHNQIFYYLTGSYIEEDPKKYVILPELNTRIVKDINLKYRFKKDNRLINTNLGYGIKIGSSAILDLIISTNLNQVSDLYLGFPHTSISQIKIKNHTINRVDSLNYKINTPWIDFNRVCKNEEGNLLINDKLIVKTNIIPNEDLKSMLYQKLQKDLKNIILGATVILN